MKFEKKTISIFYKRLISLYPKAFKERFGESMEQTFNDVCNEETKLKGKISLTFVFSIFVEISVSIFKENFSALKRAYQMNHWLKTVKTAGLISLLFTGAFWLSALLMNPDIPSEAQSEGASLSLGILFNWFVLTLILVPIVSGLRNGENMSIKDWLFPLGAAFLFGFLLTAPFAFMEYWNNPVIQSGEIQLPYLLFFAMWLFPFIFFLGATPIVRAVRAGESVLAHPVSLMLRIVFLGILAFAWVNFVRDQMPCFLGGVPGCD